MKKVIRTICYFSKDPSQKIVDKLITLETSLKNKGFEIQTKRICSPKKSFKELKNSIQDKSILLSIGSLNYAETHKKIDEFIKSKSVAFNLDLTNESISEKHTKILFKIITESPASTFSFTYTFNTASSSPYFPSVIYGKEGFTIGLQATDLAEGCNSLEEWLSKLKECWREINDLFKDQKDYLGIDSSIAPLFKGNSSLIHFIKRLHSSFNKSILTNTYLKITKFIKKENPKPIGLCGLMLPPLEDFELADEYEEGNFSIERNLFLSLHSGLGIDAYPIGVDEDIHMVTNILKTVQQILKINT